MSCSTSRLSPLKISLDLETAKCRFTATDVEGSAAVFENGDSGEFGRLFLGDADSGGDEIWRASRSTSPLPLLKISWDFVDRKW